MALKLFLWKGESRTTALRPAWIAAAGRAVMPQRSALRRAGRVSVEIRRPVVHEPPSAVEQVRPP